MKNIIKQILLKIKTLNSLIQFILLICMIFLNDLKSNISESKINNNSKRKSISIKQIRSSFIIKIRKIYNKTEDDTFKKLFYDYFFKNPLKHWHKFHIVSPSPWPFFVSLNLLSFLLHFVSLLDRDYTSIPGLLFGLFFLILAIIFWFRDITWEATYMGYHTIKVQMMHRTGFALFLVSEVMIFFGVFWAYFHFSLTPSIFGGNIWPPEGIVLFFLSEDLWSELRFLYLAGYYDYTLNQNYLNFFDGLVGYSRESFIFIYIFLYYLFDIFAIFNIDFFYYNPLKIIETQNLLSTSLVNDFKIKFFKKIYSFSNYNLYSLNPFYDNPINYESRVIYLNVYDRGALINPYHIPLLNTLVLLTSGCILMWSHTCLRLQSYFKSVVGLLITIFLALYFIGCQAYEYIHAPFSINDGSYGSIFYLLTGLHGFHVIIGTIFLSVCLYRLIDAHFTSTNHFGFEASIWYWHFVDVVWIFLYIFVYIWPSIYYFSSSSSFFIDNLHSLEIEFFDDFAIPRATLNTDLFIKPNKNLYFNINYRDIKNKMLVFDYNKNIWHDFSIKIPIIYYSFIRGIPSSNLKNYI